MKKIKYTAKDFDTLFNELKIQAQSLFPSWTDFSESNIGTILLELYAMVGDMLSYYENHQANEAYIGTVTKKKNMIALCERIGYKLSTSAAASVDLVFTLDAVHTKDVIIKQGTVVTTEDESEFFETIEDKTISAGDLSVTVSAKNWTSREDFFTGDGSENQKYLLTENNFIQDTDTVFVNSAQWTRVEDFLNSGPSDNHYVIELDADNEDKDIAYLVFGNGISGAKPIGDIDVKYKTGGGVSGNNVQSNALIKITSDIFDSDNDIVNDITVNNALSPSGGADSENIDLARLKAPKSIKTSNRTVTKEDFEIHAEEVNGVVRALAETWKQNPLIPQNTTYVYIVPDGGGVPSQALKDEVENVYLNEKPIIITHEVEIKDPLYDDLNISCNITAVDLYDATQKADLQNRVRQALIDWFDFGKTDEYNNYNVDFGKELPVSVIYDIIQSVEGVKKVDNLSPSSNITVQYNHIIKLNDISGVIVLRVLVIF